MAQEIIYLFFHCPKVAEGNYSCFTLVFVNVYFEIANSNGGRKNNWHSSHHLGCKSISITFYKET